MTKRDIVEAIAKKTGSTKKDAEVAFTIVFDSITAAMKKEGITIPGFGTFKSKKRKARTGINPLTKKPLKIPAKTVPTFKASKTLKEKF